MPNLKKKYGTRDSSTNAPSRKKKICNNHPICVSFLGAPRLLFHLAAYCHKRTTSALFLSASHRVTLTRSFGFLHNEHSHPLLKRSLTPSSFAQRDPSMRFAPLFLERVSPERTERNRANTTDFRDAIFPSTPLRIPLLRIVSTVPKNFPFSFLLAQPVQSINILKSSFTTVHSQHLFESFFFKKPHLPLVASTSTIGKVTRRPCFNPHALVQEHFPVSPPAMISSELDKMPKTDRRTVVEH